MGPLPALDRRSRRSATAAALIAVAIGAAAAPALADDRAPVADALRATSQAVPTVGVVVDRAEAAVPAIEPVASRLRTSVAAVRAHTPVGSALQAARAPIGEATAGAVPAVRVVAERTSAATTGPRADGGIDRRASRRDGRPAGTDGGSSGAATAFAPGPPALPADPAERARSSASSTSSSGDDGDHDHGFPPFGHDGDSTLLGGPAGIALIALGMLAALLTLIPRFSSRLIPMSPARWGPVAFLVPIERPG